MRVARVTAHWPLITTRHEVAMPGEDVLSPRVRRIALGCAWVAVAGFALFGLACAASPAVSALVAATVFGF